MKRIVVGVVVAMGLLAACGSGGSGQDSVDASDSTGASTAPDSTQNSGDEIVTSTSSIVATTLPEASTTVGNSTTTVNTAPSTTTTSSAASSTTSTTAQPPAVQVSTVAVFMEEYLVLVDTQTGEVSFSARVEGEGEYASGLRLSADGGTAHYNVGWEDYWFSCESSAGQTNAYPMNEASQPTIQAAGILWRTSPDGNAQAYVATQRCIPDPEDPANWVLVFFDTVVWVDPATQQETSVPLALGDDVEVRDIIFAADGSLLVLTTEGELRRLDPEHATVADAPILPMNGLPGESSRWGLLGVDEALGGIIVGVPTDTGLAAFAVDDNGNATKVYEKQGATSLVPVNGAFLEVIDGKLFVNGQEVLVEPQDETGSVYVWEVAWVPALG